MLQTQIIQRVQRICSWLIRIAVAGTSEQMPKTLVENPSFSGQSRFGRIYF
jgi:hypothetical protein